MAIIVESHRRPSKYYPEERGKYCNWIRHQQKLVGKDELKPERVDLFNHLLSLAGANRHVNQWK